MNYDDLEDYLLKQGIYCRLSESSNKHNRYVDINTKKELTHEEVLALIKNNR